MSYQFPIGGARFVPVTVLASLMADLSRIRADFYAAVEAFGAKYDTVTETHRATCNMPLADALTMGKQLNALLLASGRIDDVSRAFAQRRKQ